MFEQAKKFFENLFSSEGSEEESVHEFWKSLETEEKLTEEPQGKQYANILMAYKRCFVEKEGVYYVGNHRLVRNFDPTWLILELARNKAEGKYDNYLIDTWFQQTINGTSFYMLVVKATGERLNTMIPYAKEPATYRNFLEQLHQEYEKNMAIVLAEKNHE